MSNRMLDLSNKFIDLDEKQNKREREINDLRAKSEGLYFNNAGAALMPQPVLHATIGHLQLEALVGGYEAVAVVWTAGDPRPFGVTVPGFTCGPVGSTRSF
jgi:hypothetical protein